MYGNKSCESCPPPDCHYGHNAGEFDLYPNYLCEGVENNNKIIIESDYQYIECKWNVYKAENGVYTESLLFLDSDTHGNPNSNGQVIAFKVYNPEGEFQYDWSIVESERNVRIPITLENWGEWSFYFWFDELVFDAIVWYEIHAVR